MADEAKIPEQAPAAPAAAAPPASAADSPPAAAPAEAAPNLLAQFDAGKTEAPEGEKTPETPPADTPPAEAKADEKPVDEAKPEGDKPTDKPAEKPAEAKADEPKPDEPKEPAKPEPIDYAYTLPETLKMDDARKGELHTALDAFRADPTQGAQTLIDLHNKAMTEYADHLTSEQMRVWNETRKGWRTDVMADEELGGSGYQTAMGTVARMRDLLVPESERKAFDTFMEVTGAGDHPAFLKMLLRAGRYFEEGRMPPRDIKPAPDNGKNPKERRGSLLYDHPRSPQNRQ